MIIRSIIRTRMTVVVKCLQFAVTLEFASIGIGRQRIISRKMWNLKVTEFDNTVT